MEVRKILGTNKPTAATDTPLYSVPSGKQAVVSRIIACNQDNTTPDPIRIAICLGSTPDPSGSEWIVYDRELAINETYILPAITMAESNTIIVFSKNGTSSFNAFGAEL